MTYITWITTIEKLSMLEYNRLPNRIKDRIRANYQEYCELNWIVAQKVRI